MSSTISTCRGLGAYKVGVLIHGATAPQIFVVTWFNVIVLATFFRFKIILLPNSGMLSSDMGGLYAGTVDNL